MWEGVANKPDKYVNKWQLHIIKFTKLCIEPKQNPFIWFHLELNVHKIGFVQTMDKYKSTG